MGEFVLNDSNYVEHRNADYERGVCGCLPRKSTFGSLPYAQPQTIDLIPWEEMPDRISDQAKNETSLWHIWRDSGAWKLNQNPLNYCWSFSGANALMLTRAKMGLPFVQLSGSSIAAPVVNWRNIGYYPEEALKQLVSVGAASTDFVPEATINARDFKSGWDQDAAQYKVTMWVDVQPSYQEIFTRLLLNEPLPCGLDWWMHAVCFGQLLDRYPRMPASSPNRYGIKFLNSWGDWGDDGWGIVEGNRMMPSQIYGILQAAFAGGTKPNVSSAA